jgi:hypothetical protein
VARTLARSRFVPLGGAVPSFAVASPEATEVIVKALATAFLLLAALAASPAAADPFARHAPSGVFAPVGAAGSIVVPPEWAGVWATVDSSYLCTGALQSVTSSSDTLCTGQVFVIDSSAVCTGTFDASSYTMHCTATGQVFPDCNYTITIDAHGTRTVDSFFSVVTFTTSYSGTGTGCDLLPPQCQQTNTHGTRTGPAPPAYCATPAVGTSWGKLKATYR